VNKLVITAAIAAFAAMPSILLAADDTAMKPAMKPTYICHAAAASATPNAMMGSTGMMCTKVDTAKMDATVSKVHAMEGNMDAPTREQVEKLERMITEGMYGG
jgi:hypothetical protein